jgi:hypothetical protein
MPEHFPTDRPATATRTHLPIIEDKSNIFNKTGKTFPSNRAVFTPYYDFSSSLWHIYASTRNNCPARPHSRATSPALPELPGHDATAGHTLKNTQYFRKNSWYFRIFCQYFRKNCQYFRFPQARCPGSRAKHPRPASAVLPYAKAAHAPPPRIPIFGRPEAWRHFWAVFSDFALYFARLALPLQSKSIKD